jgi:hypothetical protein
MCGKLPNSISSGGQWITVTCNNDLSTVSSGIQGTSVLIEPASGNTLNFCGLKAFGSQTVAAGTQAGLIALAVNSSNIPHVVNKLGEIYSFTEGDSPEYAHVFNTVRASTIGIAAQSPDLVVHVDKITGQILTSLQSLTLGPGPAAKIAAAKSTLWTADQAGNIRRRTGYAAAGSWVSLPQKAVDIAAGYGDEGTATASVFIIDPSDNSIKEWSSDTEWSKMTATPKEPLRIKVDHTGLPWVSDAHGQIFRYTGVEWTWQAEGTKEFAISSGGKVWALTLYG